MIAVSERDIGRAVIYKPYLENERGVITSFNDKYIFVRYEKQHPTSPGQATNPADLEFET